MANKNTYTPYEEVNNTPRRSKGNGTFLARPAFWITICCFIAALITLNASCTVIDSGEIGIKFHKWSANEQDYGGVEGTCKGWVFYNPITTSVFSYPTYIQRKNYEAFNVNAKDASVFSMDPTIAYRINPEKACDIFTKYRKGIEDLENGYIRTCIYEAYRTCANQYTSDSLMSNRANFERDVRSRLESSLMDEGFIVEEFTSQITPPQSLAQMINEKNAAVQSALKAENKVKEAEAEAKIRIAEAKGAAEAMQIKADAEAYYNRTIAASLSPLIVQEDWIEKWNGTVPTVMSGQNMMLDMSSIIGKK
ncbi:MAG: prohibitin family protein [Bacteroidales bacterium]|nr:prohibitin family protein [Bacteroidales bacterium]